MLLRYLLAGSMVVIASAPALAAPEYFVLVGANRQCQLIEVQPLDTAAIYGGSGYLTPEDAKAATASSCDSSAFDGASAIAPSRPADRAR